MEFDYNLLETLDLTKYALHGAKNTSTHLGDNGLKNSDSDFRFSHPLKSYGLFCVDNRWKSDCSTLTDD